MAPRKKTKSHPTKKLKNVRSKRVKKTVTKTSRKPASKSKQSKPGLVNELLLRTVIDILPDAIYVKDIASRKIMANLADVRNLGLQSESEVLGKDDFPFFAKEVAEKFYADDQEVIQNGQPVINREEYFIDRQSKKHWLLTSKLPLWDESGKVTGIVGIGRDITKRKQAEEEVLYERHLTKTLLDNIPDLIYFINTDGRYVLNNSNHVRSLNAATKEEVLGKTCFDFYPAELAKRNNEIEMEVMRSGKAMMDKEDSVIEKATGEKRLYKTSKIPIKNLQGNTIGLLSLSRAVVENKRS